MVVSNTLVNGTIIDAGPLNENFTDVSTNSAVYTSAAEVNGNATTFKTVTIGGTFTGTRLIFLTFEGKLSASSEWAHFDVKKNGETMNACWNNLADFHTFAVNETSYVTLTIPIPVVTSDVITIYAERGGGAITEYVRNLNIFGGGPDMTFS